MVMKTAICFLGNLMKREDGDDIISCNKLMGKPNSLIVCQIVGFYRHDHMAHMQEF